MSMRTTVTLDDADYAKLRLRYFNARVPKHQPAEISLPSTTKEVSEILQTASKRGLKVGVRSSGHLFPCCSLIQDGLLIDTINLNRHVDYDPVTEVISFGPATTSREASQMLAPIKRFFPFGHSPTVAAGGFLLCGGQGWFMRGWGCTSDTWVVSFEVVMPDGRIIEASRESHPDVFWAARGAGQGFFGVVTRIHVKTIPARQVYDKAIVFDSDKAFEKICAWMFEANDHTPKYGTECAAATVFADRNTPPMGDEIQDPKLLMVVNAVAFADSLEEAQQILSAYSIIPDDLKSHLIVENPVQQKTWDQLFQDQDMLNPSGKGERWQCDSILNDPKVPRTQLIKAIKPAMCDLPTRRSVGCIYIADYYPDGQSAALSLPQEFYIATMTCWTTESDDAKMRNWMLGTYKKLDSISVGQYIADFDSTHRVTSIMSNTALSKWLKIRDEWDPQHIFPSSKVFGLTLKHGTRL